MTRQGFPVDEFESRTKKAQTLMAQHGLDALLLTTEADVRYFTGFLTRFWESPARPWFVVVPAKGKPIAIIPSIGLALMETTWVDDIRSWRSPDLTDDGVSLLAQTIRETLGASGRLGVPSGHETHLRMPLADFEQLKSRLAPISITDDGAILRELRMVKSPREIAKIESAVKVAERAFARIGEFAQEGARLDQIFRRFQITCLEEGADFVPYLAGGAGENGYTDVISPAGSKQVEAGDILMLDTGLIVDGYFCDFDRNFAIKTATLQARNAHKRLIEAVEAAFEIARPGTRAADLFLAMDRVLQTGSDAGRLGHGLGQQLTEWPSIIADDQTPMQQGMVMTLEPSLEVQPGRVMVHEENIVITHDGARYLTQPASAELPVI